MEVIFRNATVVQFGAFSHAFGVFDTKSLGAINNPIGPVVEWEVHTNQMNSLDTRCDVSGRA